MIHDNQATTMKTTTTTPWPQAGGLVGLLLVPIGRQMVFD